MQDRSLMPDSNPARPTREEMLERELFTIRTDLRARLTDEQNYKFPTTRDKIRFIADSHEQTIHEIRKRLWLGHGHVGLYGDDGEMQCSLGGCMLDFKRDPLDKIIDRLNEQREQTIQQLRLTIREKQDEADALRAALEHETQSHLETCNRERQLQADKERGFLAFCAAQAEWSQATFGTDAERGPIGPLKHLAKEVQEALENIDDEMEYVDCFFLVLDASRRKGMTAARLLERAFEKLEINKRRKWNKPTSDNPVEHDRSLDAVRGVQLAKEGTDAVS